MLPCYVHEREARRCTVVMCMRVVGRRLSAGGGNNHTLVEREGVKDDYKSLGRSFFSDGGKVYTNGCCRIRMIKNINVSKQ